MAFEIDQELSDLAYGQVKLDFAGSILSERLDNFKKFIQNHAHKTTDLNAILHGVHRYKMEVGIGRLTNTDPMKKLRAEYEFDMVQLYWDCVILYMNYRQ